MQEIFTQWDVLLSAEGILALLTLTVLEIVLGIDNLIFISILVGKAPKDEQKKIRTLGFGLALLFRIVLLLGISWLVQLTTPIITVMDFAFSWRDLILLVGGIFLIIKSTLEIHEKIRIAQHPEEEHGMMNDTSSVKKTVSMLIVQIVAIDLIFSLDSILTAVGMTKHILIMIIAVIIAIAFMMAFAKSVGEFINKNPTIVMLALSFLLMIGTLLIADAFHFHVPRGYVYFAMGFSLFVELLNLRLLQKMRKKNSQ